ncbi:hypothetical protein AV530_011344 [Patagioenas fasciata monilis]|uniref:Uncharacterized protein n=1 Tax=Patagioenas fasciata monilis TaxID=372326 RepID=A0A1V4KP30_PATFA|nr:hypothetical protein AV530_011344 [Patagioenas fasciata monilis]
MDVSPYIPALCPEGAQLPPSRSLQELECLSLPPSFDKIGSKLVIAAGVGQRFLDPAVLTVGVVLLQAFLLGGFCNPSCLYLGVLLGIGLLPEYILPGASVVWARKWEEYNCAAHLSTPGERLEVNSCAFICDRQCGHECEQIFLIAMELLPEPSSHQHRDGTGPGSTPLFCSEFLWVGTSIPGELVKTSLTWLL